MHTAKGLSNERLKIIAVVTMLIDHIGAYLFPHIPLLRIIGRISFPVFAFMVAEGCRYTRNKKRYLLNMALLAVICHLLFYRVRGFYYFRIPTTFTLSIITIYALQYFTDCIYSNSTAVKKLAASFVLFAVVCAIRIICGKVTIDYGFYGCMTPVLISTANLQYGIYPKAKDSDNTAIQLFMLAAALWLVYRQYKGLQIYSFLAVPLLLTYNGKRENIMPKYFFYLFYPLHLAVIFAVKYLVL